MSTNLKRPSAKETEDDLLSEQQAFLREKQAMAPNSEFGYSVILTVLGGLFSALSIKHI